MYEIYGTHNINNITVGKSVIQTSPVVERRRIKKLGCENICDSLKIPLQCAEFAMSNVRMKWMHSFLLACSFFMLFSTLYEGYVKNSST